MRAVLHGFCEPLSCHTHSTGLGSMFAQLACSIALRPWRWCPSIFFYSPMLALACLALDGCELEQIYRHGLRGISLTF